MKKKLIKNFDLTDLNTFRIKTSVDYYFEVKNKDDLFFVLTKSRKKGLPIIVLGNGSNILLPDKRVKAIVIKIMAKKIGLLNEKKIIAQAGVNLSQLINFAAERSLSGLENLAGIPGTVGGAIFGNAGSFGREIRDILEEVRVFSLNPPYKEKILKKDKCQFGYRNSFFKKRRNFIIWEGVFSLRRSKKDIIRKRIRTILEKRVKKMPLNYPSAGSFFKNVPLKNFPEKIREELKSISKDGLVPSGYLIDKAGLKNLKVGGVKISPRHANFIVNTGKARSKDIRRLAEIVQEKVKEKFGVELEPEVIFF